MLEDNQVLVQGMMANRYMATFREPITGWNKKLMAVADVVQLLVEIQRTWAYLESLFIGSEEVGGGHRGQGACRGTSTVNHLKQPR